jgi:hypothetical protein
MVYNRAVWQLRTLSSGEGDDHGLQNIEHHLQEAAILEVVLSMEKLLLGTICSPSVHHMSFDCRISERIGASGFRNLFLALLPY